MSKSKKPTMNEVRQTIGILIKRMDDLYNVVQQGNLTFTEYITFKQDGKSFTEYLKNKYDDPNNDKKEGV